MLEAIDLVQFVDSDYFSQRLKQGSSFLSDTSFVIVSALSYNRPLSTLSPSSTDVLLSTESLEEKPLPWGYIAPFTRANFYRTHELGIRKLLKEAGLTRKQFKTSINGVIREKAYAIETGFALPGKNSILLTPELGSTFVLAITKIQESARELIIRLWKSLIAQVTGTPDTPAPMRSPIISSGKSLREPMTKSLREPMTKSLCNNCRLCETQCPTLAIKDGKVDCYTCLQSLSGKHVPMDATTMNVWGNRFYGCSTCQDVCPINTSSTMRDNKLQVKSLVGKKVNLLKILSLSTSDIKERFKGNQIGASWVNPMALKRNSLLALGNIKGKVDSATFVQTLETLRKYALNADPVLSTCAKNSLKRLLNR